MRFLRVLGFGLVDVRRFRQVVVAVALGDERANLLDRFLRQIHRVGTHVADETDGLAADVHAFVQLLGGAHGALRGEAEFARRLLLQGGGGERRRRIALALLLLDRGDKVAALCLLEQLGLDLGGAVLVADRELVELLALELGELGAEILALGAEIRLDGPVLARLEALDLFLALDDQAQRRALHAPGG